MPRPKGSKNKVENTNSTGIPTVSEPISTGIHATVTTNNMPFTDVVVKAKAKPAIENVDLTKCLRCGAKLDKYVASADGKFCNDTCLKEYYE